MEIGEFVWTNCRKAALEAIERQAAKPYDACFIYYKTGELRAFSDSDDTTGYQLAWSQRVPAATPEQIRNWIHQFASRVPFLPANSPAA